MAKLYSIITSHLLLQTVFVVGVNAAFLLSSSSSSTNCCSPIRLLNNNNHCNTVIPTTRQQLVTAIEASSSSDDSTNHAEAFTQYMAKSHEDKLRAVKAVEDKKNAEIEDLKRQIEEKKSGTTTTTTSSSIVPANGSNGSMEVISAKLTAYQTFMSQYIVKAQDEKFNAIRAAEATISKKYEDKLSAFMLTGAADASSITISSQSSTTSVVKESTKEPVVVLEPVPDATIAFVVEGVMKESVKEETKIPAAVPKPAAETKAPVVDSVKETKDETKKPVAAKVEKKKPVSKVEVVPAEKSTADPPKTDDDGSTPPEVIAADHGLRADGGGGGLTLAERVSQGADSSAGLPVNGSIDDANGSSSSAIIDPSCLTSAGTIIDPRYRVYFETMTVISTAAKAKAHNRWGPKEEQLATEYVAETLALAAAVAAGGGSAQPAAVTSSSNGVVVEANQEPKAEVEEADHGLRADGGVGGPSLAQRVNLGAQLLNKT